MNWLDAMRTEIDKANQSSVARQLGVSASRINQVLKGTYKGNLNNLEKLVRGTFMKATVVCPIMGEISQRKCLDEQVRPFAPTNPQRIAVYRACRNGCENYRK